VAAAKVRARPGARTIGERWHAAVTDGGSSWTVDQVITDPPTRRAAFPLNDSAVPLAMAFALRASCCYHQVARPRADTGSLVPP
jgi:hypothetical protein